MKSRSKRRRKSKSTDNSLSLQRPYRVSPGRHNQHGAAGASRCSAQPFTPCLRCVLAVLRFPLQPHRRIFSRRGECCAPALGMLASGQLREEREHSVPAYLRAAEGEEGCRTLPSPSYCYIIFLEAMVTLSIAKQPLWARSAAQCGHFLAVPLPARACMGMPVPGRDLALPGHGSWYSSAAGNHVTNSEMKKTSQQAKSSAKRSEG